MKIILGDLNDPQVIALLHTHVERARAESPPCSAHALDREDLRAPEISFWAAWEGEQLAGVAALKDLGAGQGEIKSMHTEAKMRGAGVGKALLEHLVSLAKARGFSCLSLETGSMAYFEPARAFYRRQGFIGCAPFAGYRQDPNSVFMTMELSQP